MANTVSRRSVVYDILFEIQEGKKSASEAEKALRDVGKEANDAEKSVKNLGQQFLQFSGIQDQINKVKDSMIAFKTATAGVTGGMKLLKVALAATGIGALVVALGSIITYLTQTQRGMELVTKATDALSTGFSVIVDRISMFGEGLSLILSGKFIEGADKLRNSFKGIGEEMRREVTQSFALTDALDALEDKERDLILVQAQRRKQISELRIIARDDEKRSLEERRKALQQAIDLENAILDDELKIARERARISDERTKAGESTDEELKANIELQAKVIDLETQSNNQKRRLITELNSLSDTTKEATISFNDYTKALAAVRDAQLFLNTSTKEGREQYEKLDEQALKLTETLNNLLQIKGEIIDVSNQELQITRQLNLEYQEASTQNVANGYLELKLLEQERVAREQLNSVMATSGQALQTLAGLAKQGSELQLALSISNILINQAQAISAAIKGATEAAAATGPGAVVATPAFIATMVGTVISTFAQVFSVINQAKAAQSQASAFAEGEIDIHRPGETRGKDSIPAVIMPGESVITTDKTSKYKPFLKAIHEGTLEDLIRVNYVEPALAVTAMEQAGKDSMIDYSPQWYRQYRTTLDGNSLNKQAIGELRQINKKLSRKNGGWYV